MAGKKHYGNESISALKGADRVRKRPGVIFGSDGLDGCEHAVFEILSNSIDEAREGHGRSITVTRFLDHSVEVEDAGRGCPVDWNEKDNLIVVVSSIQISRYLTTPQSLLSREKINSGNQVAACSLPIQIQCDHLG